LLKIFNCFAHVITAYFFGRLLLVCAMA
jgi:hypothetical protein